MIQPCAVLLVIITHNRFIMATLLDCGKVLIDLCPVRARDRAMNNPQLLHSAVVHRLNSSGL